MWKQAHGAAPRTLEDYRKRVSQFYRQHPEAWYPDRLKAAAYAFLAEPVKPATYNLRLVYLRAFLSWCVKEGIYPENPLAGFRRRKDPGRQVRVAEEVLAELLQQPDRKTYAGLRDFAALLVFLDTGIRPSELFSLLPSDVDLRAGEIRVRPEIAKTRVPRTLPLTPPAVGAVRQLLAARHPLWPETVPLFASENGTRLAPSSWRDRLKKYMARIGVRLRPYDLRHAFALLFLKNGGHALALQRFLGHADLTMCKRYVALTQKDLRKQHALASPLQSLLPRRHRVRKVRAQDQR
jgi:site-specific recombinase XerD